MERMERIIINREWETLASSTGEHASFPRGAATQDQEPYPREPRAPIVGPSASF